MSKHSRDHVHSCVSLVPIFNHLEKEQMDEISATAHTRQFKKGEFIYQPQEESNSLYIVHKGFVRIYRLTESGKEQLVRFLGPGDFTGEMALFRSSLHDSFAEATRDTSVCVITKDELQPLLAAYPAISLKILAEFSNRLEQSERQTTIVATEKVEIRLAMFLVELLEEGSNIATLPMTKKDLASFLGTTPETISRKLGAMEDRGLIRHISNREIAIMDADELLLG